MQAILTETTIPESGLPGICPVCGENSIFSGFTQNTRESGFCSNCGSYNRQRQMAATIRDKFRFAPYGEFDFFPSFSIFNTESNGALHKALAKYARYTCSEFFGPDVERGTLINGVMHQDLQALTFIDGTFDLVLSSDVFEHMPRPYDAHREVFRVLRPGGRHIFTVPFNPHAPSDNVRAVESGGEITYFGEKLYHGDPVRPEEGVLVWTIFGLQMISELEQIGFNVSYKNMISPERGIIGAWSLVFDAQKP
jgi:SAM-dependent methyltransferase